MKRIGLSTGMYYKFFSSLAPGVIKRCRGISTGALEICCVGGVSDRGVHLDALDVASVSGFEFLSLHAPSSQISYDDNQASYDILDTLQRAWDRLPLNHIVFHPDTIKDWKIFDRYSFNPVIENMDNRKSYGTQVRHLLEIFDTIDCGFVLDLNHCYSHDRTMRLADDLLDKFSSRLYEVHVSGYTDYHNMLYQTKQEEIYRYLPQLDVPIIIESVCTATYQPMDEFAFVRDHA